MLLDISVIVQFSANGRTSQILISIVRMFPLLGRWLGSPSYSKVSCMYICQNLSGHWELTRIVDSLLFCSTRSCDSRENLEVSCWQYAQQRRKRYTHARHPISQHPYHLDGLLVHLLLKSSQPSSSGYCVDSPEACCPALTAFPSV